MLRTYTARALICSWTLLVQVILPSRVPGQTGPVTRSNEWAILLPSLSDSSPAVGSDGTIYFGTFTGDLYALRSDGVRKWIFSAGREIKGSPGIGSDGTIYFGSRNRKFYAVRPNGQQAWEFKTAGWVDTSPAIGSDNSVYFGSWDTSFYALSAEGVKKWQFPTAGEIESSPAIGADGTIYFGSHDGKFYALAPQGNKVWDYPTGGPIISSPAIDKDGSIYVSSVDGFLYALNPEGGLKWRLKTGGITESSPILGQDGTIFLGVNEKLWAIATDGKRIWERPGQLFISATALALADDSVCFVAQDGYLLNVSARAQCKWIFPLGYGGAAPAIGPGGTIYAIGAVFNVGFKLYAVSNEVGVAQSSWAKFRGNVRNTGQR